jgi:predicted XRE-type DNA-binding protein
MTRKTRRTTGNVFTALGFGPGEAGNLKLRAELMIELTKLIRTRRLTQTQAVTLFGVRQPRVSDLVRGGIDRFSIDMLVSMLGRAGADVSLQVRPPRKIA